MEIGCNPEMVKNLSFSYSKKNDKIFLVLVAKNKDKVYLTCYISKEIVNEENFNANTIVKSLSKHINGSGGGQPFFASASGNNIQGVGELLKEALKII